MPVTAVRLVGLDKAEVLKLREVVPSSELRVNEEPRPEGSFGELALATAIVFASAAALKGIVAYLAHSKRGDEIEQEIEIEHEDGRTERRHLRIRRRSQDPIDAQVARELSTVTGFPVESLLPDVA
jgi:hypothetical protein